MPPITPLNMLHSRFEGFHTRLTKLYSDTKQSYQTADVTTPPPNVNEEQPEVKALQRALQIQQDRLLAWGIDWADTNAADARNLNQGGDVQIDDQLEQAGLGDEVATSMLEIQRLLEESGKLQQAEKRDQPIRQLSGNHPGWLLSNEKAGNNASYITTGTALLQQLTACIDHLYGLSASRRANQGPDWGKKNDLNRPLPPPPMEETSKKSAQQDEEDSLVGLGGLYKTLSESQMYIQLDTIRLYNSPVTSSLSPPPYDQASIVHRDTALGLLGSFLHVMVDFVPVSQFASTPGMPLRFDVMAKFNLALQRLTAATSASHQGQLSFMGFVVDADRAQIGFVYELPASYYSDTRSTPLNQPAALCSVLAASYGNSKVPSPPLEDRFRLAYNLVISMLGYMAHGICHRNINSGNVLFFEEAKAASREQTPDIRLPYLLPAAQQFVVGIPEPLSSEIYRHPADDVTWNEMQTVPALEIYSLGLVLLEIGSFMPIAKTWKSKYDRAAFMTKIKTIYVKNLASKCGGRYMKIVQKCLNAPETLNISPGLSDAVEFLFGIADDLSKCCQIDEAGAPPVATDMAYFRQLLNLQNLQSQNSSSPIVSAGPSTIRSIETRSPHHIMVDKSNFGTNEAVKADEKPATSHSLPQLRKFPNLSIPQEHLDQWNTMLMPRLSTLLQKALSGSPESSSVSLMMVGPSPEKAKTTICIQCRDTARVCEALRARFKPKRGWGVVVQKGQVMRSGKRKTKKRGKINTAESTPIGKVREQLHHLQPGCGASIGAFRDCEHLPPVSFGGTILVDGEPFGMTVHHMLDAPSDDEEDSDDEDIQRSSATRQSAARSMEAQMESLHFASAGLDVPDAIDDELEISDEDFDDADSDASTIKPDYAAFDADGDEHWFLDDTPHVPNTPELQSDNGSDGFEHLSDDESEGSDDEDDNCSIGDRNGISPYGCEEQINVTQPAIDDVDEDFFPNKEDRNEDHLDSHSFGYVYASSGIRRVVTNDLKHEVDWALIRIQQERMNLRNTISQDTKAKRKKRSKSNREPRTDNILNTPGQRSDVESKATPIVGIAASDNLANTPVSCCGRSSGFRNGRISQAMALVKMYGRQSFSSSWCVEGGFGIPGDSGAWVYNPATRELCGHVLAWGNKSQTAYIAPMDVLFEDIKATLGAEKVSLPVEIQDQKPLPLTPAKTEEDEFTDAQLQKSKILEVALEGIKLSKDDNKKPDTMIRPTRKDISPYRQNESQRRLIVGVAEAAS
jgi:hypothetical protein